LLRCVVHCFGLYRIGNVHEYSREVNLKSACRDFVFVSQSMRARLNYQVESIVYNGGRRFPTGAPGREELPPWELHHVQP